jgi:hypothetical protein
VLGESLSRCLWKLRDPETSFADRRLVRFLVTGLRRTLRAIREGRDPERGSPDSFTLQRVGDGHIVRLGATVLPVGAMFLRSLMARCGVRLPEGRSVHLHPGLAIVLIEDALQRVQEEAAELQEESGGFRIARLVRRKVRLLAALAAARGMPPVGKGRPPVSAA